MNGEETIAVLVGAMKAAAARNTVFVDHRDAPLVAQRYEVIALADPYYHPVFVHVAAHWPDPRR